MQTPDLEQVRAWLSGEDALPDIEQLKAVAIELGARRTRMRAETNELGALVRKLAVLLYKHGCTNQAELSRSLGLAHLTLDKDLTDAGIPRGRTTPREAALRDIDRRAA